MNRKTSNRWIVFFLCLFLPFLAWAQATIDVRGVVSDTSGEPIIGAVVKIKGTEKATVTGIDSALFAQPGFSDKADRFSLHAVMLPSAESGITIPSQGITVNSALGAHFDSFGLERLVTIPDNHRLLDIIEGVPATHVIILANTDKYGGSGSYNEYAIASAHSNGYPEILIHEIGNSFAWLGDEYEAGYSVTYTPDQELLEPNISTLHDFASKWQDLIDAGQATLVEGAGYQSTGVWRGSEHCLMRSVTDTLFCPVCARAISRTIDYLTIPD